MPLDYKVPLISIPVAKMAFKCPTLGPLRVILGDQIVLSPACRPYVAQKSNVKEKNPRHYGLQNPKLKSHKSFHPHQA